MSNGIMIYPRKFTFRRMSTGPMPDPAKTHILYRPQWCDMEETFVAYMIFISAAQDGFNVQFYDLSPEGDPHIIKVVTRVTQIDNGVRVEQP